MPIDRELLKQIADFEQSEQVVRNALGQALEDPSAILRYFLRYTHWNGWFGSAVAGLAGRIGSAREVFVDESEPVAALADRSVFVASFFFDAARDEFDDRDTEHRDTHRCLAQALLYGLIEYSRKGLGQPELDAALTQPTWLAALRERVARGYGSMADGSAPSIFSAIGYHLGSEVYADKEFSVMDSLLQEKQPELVRFLEQTHLQIEGTPHGCYQWLRIHSGHGGGAEADHFEWALEGVKLAFRYASDSERDVLLEHTLAGYRDFALDHAMFFRHVLES